MGIKTFPPVATPVQELQSLFNHFADVSTTGTGAVDLYSDTLAAGQLATNGDKIHAYYAGTTTVTNTGNRTWTAFFGGTKIFDSKAQGASQSWSWEMFVDIIRESATVVRCITTWSGTKTDGSGTTLVQTQYLRVTGLTLSNTQIIKIQGQASVAGNDITASMGSVQYIVA